MLRIFSYCILLIVFSVNSIFAFQTNLDSLKTAAVTSSSDSVKLNIYFQLIFAYVNSELDSAKKYLDLVSEPLKKYPDSPFEQQYYDLKGSYYQKKGDFKEASENYLKCAKLAEKLNLKEELFYSQNNLQLINSKLGNHPLAIFNLKKLIPLAENLNKEKIYVTLYSNIAINFLMMNLPDSAKKYFNVSYPLTKTNGFYRAAVGVNLAYLNYLAGKYQQTIKYARESAAIAKKLNRTELYLESLTNISNAYYSLGEFKKAIEYSTLVMKIASKKKLRKQLADSYGNLSMAYEGTKDFETALKFNKMYSALHDSLFNAEVSKQINEMQIKYETEKKDRMLSIKDAAIEKQNIIIRYTVAIAISFVIFFIVVFILYEKKQKAYHNLTKMHVTAIKKEEKEKRKFPTEKEEINTDKLSEDTVEQLYEELERKIDEEKLFTQKDLTLGKLAGELNISAKYISQVVHKKYGVSFPDFINNLRIKEAARLLIDPAYENFSLEGIADISGFKSRSVFNYSFKKFMGVTPSFYKESAKKILGQGKSIII